MKNYKGFTLIELLVVIAIIGLLAAIILATLTSARAKSRDATRLSTLVQIAKLMQLNSDTNPQLNGGGIRQLYTGGAAYVRVSGVTTFPELAQYKDPSGNATPCVGSSGGLGTPTQTLSTGVCDYSFATFGATPISTPQNFEVCTYLETNAGPYAGTSGGGLVNIDETGTIVKGCP